MRQLLLISLFVCSGAWASPEPGKLDIKLEVEKYQLPNGLTVLLYEDHSAPLISFHSWFRVGSKHERPGITGIAHLFEHMMFKGAKRYGVKAYDRILEANGGNNNAFTSRDYTGYYIDLPSNKLELAIDLESDRMESLQINAENLTSEREVVKEERRMRVDNDVSGVLNEAIYGTVFKEHNYRWPVIGWPEDLDKISLEDCQKFFKTFYSPNNAVLVVAGDFEKENAKKLIAKYYSHIPSQVIPPLDSKAEPKQTQGREKIIKKEVQNQTLAVAYRAAKAGEDDYYALDLLASILGDGPSSRLYRKLVYDKQIATDVSVSNYAYQEPGVFQFVVSLKPGVKSQDALMTILAEAWNSRNKKVTDAELKKAKVQIMKGYVDALKTLHGKAELLATNEIMFGSWERLLKDLDTYQSITAEQIKQAASKYLNPYQRSDVVVIPGPAQKKKVGP